MNYYYNNDEYSLIFTSLAHFTQHRYIYALAGSDATRSTPQQGLLKIDTFTQSETSWMPEKYEFLSEPIFITRHQPSPTATTTIAEDDGYIATYLSNGRDMKSELLLFDASRIQQGPVHRIPLPVYMSVGLHGNFVDGLVFNEEDMMRKFKVNKALDSKRWNEVNSGFSGLGISYDF